MIKLIIVIKNIDKYTIKILIINNDNNNNNSY